MERGSLARLFLYQGKLAPARGIELILDAFEGLEDANKVLVFLGNGPLEAHIKAAAARSENIFLHSAVPPDTLLDYTASADVVFAGTIWGRFLLRELDSL